MRGASGRRQCSRGCGRWRLVVRLGFFESSLLRGSFKGGSVTRGMDSMGAFLHLDQKKKRVSNHKGDIDGLGGGHGNLDDRVMERTPTCFDWHS